MKHLKLGNLVAALAMAGALILATAPKSHAEDARARCQSRVEKAHDHYRAEVRAHGRESHQAQEAKERLSNEWQRCYTEAHGWYDPQSHQWRSDRDWDHYNWDNDYNRPH
ncbi:MAG TPA: hypothetical protein VLW06_02975 [Terriglobales bacterium]|nr:hypothetical protein [Terriglobales bacterium]